MVNSRPAIEVLNRLSTNEETGSIRENVSIVQNKKEKKKR